MVSGCPAATAAVPAGNSCAISDQRSFSGSGNYVYHWLAAFPSKLIMARPWEDQPTVLLWMGQVPRDEWDTDSEKLIEQACLFS